MKMETISFELDAEYPKNPQTVSNMWIMKEGIGQAHVKSHIRVVAVWAQPFYNMRVDW